MLQGRPITMTTLDECYDLLDSYRREIRRGKQPALSKTMRKVIMDTAYISGEDSCWDDGYYEQYIPDRVRGRCSTDAALDGLQTIFMKIGDVYRTRKDPTPTVILQMVYGQGREEWEYRGRAKKYLDAGGTVEDALQAVCKMAKISIGDGGFDEDEAS